MTYLITFACYGTHLHGDERGSVDRHNNQPGAPLIEPNPEWLSLERHLMQQPPYTLDPPRRDAVLASLLDRCTQSGWHLYAAHVRSNHVHIILDADAAPERIMNDLKSYASRHLNRSGFDTPHTKRWARHGSARLLRETKEIKSAVKYVLEKQGDPMSAYIAPRYR